MKILITGTRGLANALGDVHIDHDVTLVSRSSGYDINDINRWGLEFLDRDCVYNCAYDAFAQIKVLEFFYHHWKDDISKKIITIGSCIITYKRTDSETGYWAYRLHKQTLQQAHDAMLLTARCDMKIINPGPINTDMISHLSVPKLSPEELAQRIIQWAADPYVKRIDCWI